MKNNCLSELNTKAKEMIFSLPKTTSVRVVSHYDADGITAASMLCVALRREGYDFHVTLMRNPFTKGFERLYDEENELIVFCDMGSGQIREIEKLGCKAVICDHHQPIVKKNVVGESIVQINAHLCGIDGSHDASGSTLVFSLVTAMNAENSDLLPLALVGAVGDKQHLGGFKGYNKELLEMALEVGLVVVSDDWLVSDECVFDEIYYSVEPFFKGLSGRKYEVDNLLARLNISGNKRVDELSVQGKTRLKSLLVFKLLKQGCSREVISMATNNKYWAESLGITLERFAELLDACGKQGERGLGLLVCLDNEIAKNRAVTLRHDFRQMILEGLIRLEDEGAKERDALQYFYADDASLGGVIGGIAINYCLDQNKPVLSLARKDDELHVSARGNQFLIKKGVDLGSALKKSAEKFNGMGGGHNVAAGATVSLEFEEKFLDEVNRVIMGQLMV